MRLVLTALAFVAGIVAGYTYGLQPEGAVPQSVWLATLGASVVTAAALALMSRNPLLPMLVAVALLGLWRGGQAFDPAGVTTVVASAPELPGITAVREAIAATLREHVPGDAGGIAAGMLVGDRRGISTETLATIRAAGLAHLMAISGLHVAMVGGITMTAATWAVGRQRNWHLVAAVIAVAVYALLSGFAPPVIRASIMFSVVVLARLSGRSTLMLPTLALAALIMVAAQPELVASVSFQLSFAAMAGIALVAPRLDALTEIRSDDAEVDGRDRSLRARVLRFVRGSMVVSVAATVATAPIVGIHFGVVPLWSVVSTLFALPSVPLIIVTAAFVAAIGSLGDLAIAGWIAYVAWVPSAYLIAVARAFEALPFTGISAVSWTVTLAVVFYAVGGAVLVAMPLLGRLGTRLGRTEAGQRAAETLAPAARSSVPWWSAATLMVASGAMLVGATMDGSDRDASYLSVKFLSIDAGESTLITTPNGNRVLLDAGLDPTEAATVVASALGPFDNRLDLVILSHPDADHVGGMAAVLRRFDVGAILHTGVPADSQVYAEWESLIAERSDVSLARAGTTIGIDVGTYLEVVNAGCQNPTGRCGNVNDTSAVFRLVHGDVSMLLTADIESATERRLVRERRRGLASTVLKVAHHGSTTSSTPEFIRAVDPAVAVFAVGYGSASDRFGHPDPSIYRRVATFVPEDRIFRTDTQGTVELTTDGTRLWVRH